MINKTPQNIIIGGTDKTDIGNSSDKLKTIDQDAIVLLTAIAGATGGGGGVQGISRQNEYAVAQKAKQDIPSTTYTVPVGKTFLLNTFTASYNNQSAIFVRLEKQTGGAGGFVVMQRITLQVGGQGQSTCSLFFGTGFLIGAAGDVFKMTVESDLIKGSIFSSFTGAEI